MKEFESSGYSYLEFGLPEFLEQNILKALMGDEFLSRIQNGHDVVGIFMSDSIMCLSLEKRLHFFQVLTLFQQRDGIVFTPGRDRIGFIWIAMWSDWIRKKRQYNKFSSRANFMSQCFRNCSMRNESNVSCPTDIYCTNYLFRISYQISFVWMSLCIKETSFQQFHSLFSFFRIRDTRSFEDNYFSQNNNLDIFRKCGKWLTFPFCVVLIGYLIGKLK